MRRWERLGAEFAVGGVSEIVDGVVGQLEARRAFDGRFADVLHQPVERQRVIVAVELQRAHHVVVTEAHVDQQLHDVLVVVKAHKNFLSVELDKFLGERQRAEDVGRVFGDFAEDLAQVVLQVALEECGVHRHVECRRDRRADEWQVLRLGENFLLRRPAAVVDLYEVVQRSVRPSFQHQEFLHVSHIAAEQRVVITERPFGARPHQLIAVDVVGEERRGTVRRLQLLYCFLLQLQARVEVRDLKIYDAQARGDDSQLQQVGGRFEAVAAARIILGLALWLATRDQRKQTVSFIIKHSWRFFCAIITHISSFRERNQRCFFIAIFSRNHGSIFYILE